ncbi:Imidazole glycerol phosphate synthase subunit HisF [Tsuneonella dongtanensis]|uniref:Imidazole glycerol phosphate synthase subunit HisF n=1 Tax=Tsuneonella dongtanensis TaxID=692370 RepID=A0A1B2AA28_9SPHN|nr:HisA/HisF-related TIM barrel protein [Tsuneonella dongtanensis]ANY18944.1 Imidazole glycerol phosphate synthase subunit HisF [Tsuneonella dongtanensis]
MIAKRLVGVVTVKDGWAVQSFGYSRYLPLGRPEVLVENLDRWGADEILLQCIDRTRLGLGPDFALLERIARQGVSTPMIYAGGIRSDQDAVDAVGAAADRIAVDALLRDDLDAVARASARLGNQAMVAALPMSRTGWLDYRTGISEKPGPALIEALADGVLSEAMVIDPAHEGHPGAFDDALLDIVPGECPLIAFGGISEGEQVQALLSRPRVVAVGVGNFLAYREHAIQALKEAAEGAPTRPAAYHETRYA